MLNKTEGETLPEIGRGVPVETQKWANVCEMLDIAAAAAAVEFAKLGAPTPVKLNNDNILIQEYYLLQSLVFIFWLPIKGIDRHYTYTFKLGDALIPELVASGKWPAIYANLPNLRAS